jgi:thiamine pyrophosphokinase
MGIVPNYAVGDWDSLTQKSFKKLSGIRKESLPQDKLRSDLHYAIQSACRVGVKELVCLGVTGGRPDHHLASIYELALASRQAPLESVVAYGPEGDYHFFSDLMNQPLKLKLKKGTVLSVLPLLEEAHGLSLRGFRFPMNNGALSFSSHGLSNQVSQPSCEIQLRSGCVVVMIPSEQNG